MSDNLILEKESLAAEITRDSFFINSLKLANFRNYSQLEMNIDSAPVVLTGPNGAGKTNILEAISFLAPGKGFRGARLNEVDNKTLKQSWAVHATVNNGGNITEIGTGRLADENTDKRIVKIDGELRRNHAELAGNFSLIYLTPQMDNIFIDGTASRRELLDRITYLFTPDHAKHLLEYEKLMRQRRKLIKQPRFDEEWAHSLEKMMAELAVVVAESRIKTLDLLTRMGEHKTPFPEAEISIKGSMESMLQTMPALQAEETYQNRLSEYREVDRLSGRTNYGVHRSDFIVKHTEKGLSAESCSTGEQKALLISIILAATRARREWFGLAPVVLLDEVVAHLDEKRRQFLLSEILHLKVQAWLTGVDLEFFKNFSEKMQFFSVQNANIR